MKSTIIDEILNGKREMHDISLEYRELRGKAKEIEEVLKDRLSKEDYSLVLDLQDAETEAGVEIIERYYKEGFKLGLLIGIECGE